LLNYWTYPGRTFVIAVIKLGVVPIITLFVFGVIGTKEQESITQSIGFELVKNSKYEGTTTIPKGVLESYVNGAGFAKIALGVKTPEQSSPNY
jgi:hypothetical protein